MTFYLFIHFCSFNVSLKIKMLLSNLRCQAGFTLLPGPSPSTRRSGIIINGKGRLSFWPAGFSIWLFSVIGLNFDFVGLNIVGFTLYGCYNVALFWIHSVQVRDDSNCDCLPLLCIVRRSTCRDTPVESSQSRLTTSSSPCTLSGPAASPSSSALYTR